MNKTMFGEIAVREYLISRETLEKALKKQKEFKARRINKFIGQILVENGHLTENQIELILEVQNELSLEGVTSPEVIESKKGEKVLEHAHHVLFSKSLKKWMIPVSIILVLVLIIVMLLTEKDPHQKTEVLTPDMHSKDVGLNRYKTKVKQLFKSVNQVKDYSTKTQADQIKSKTLDPKIKSTVRKAFDVNNSLEQRHKHQKELGQYSQEDVFSSALNLLIDENLDYRNASLMIQSLNRMDKTKTKELILSLIDHHQKEKLGYQLLMNVIHTYEIDSTMNAFFIKGLNSEKQDILENGLMTLSKVKDKTSKKVNKKLHALALNHEDPMISCMSFRAMNDEFIIKHIKDYMKILSQLSQSLDKEIILFVLKNNLNRQYDQLIEIASDDMDICHILVKYLRIHPDGYFKEFLFEQLKTNLIDLKIEAIRTLGHFKGQDVLKAMASSMNEEKRIQKEVIFSLRRITNKYFNYNVNRQNNEKAIQQWNKYLNRFSEDSLKK